MIEHGKGDLDGGCGLGEPAIRRALTHQVPHLERKLVSIGVARNIEQAKAIFDELKKYLALSALAPGPLPMISSTVDAAWHQFMLYSRDYEQYCQSHFGRMLHHIPNDEALVARSAEDDEIHTFLDHYQQHFGELPSLWRNEHGLAGATRIARLSPKQRFQARVEGHQALLTDGGETIYCRASQRAFAALSFIAQHDVFLVRELPGLRSLDEQLTCVRPLVQWGILLPAP